MVGHDGEQDGAPEDRADGVRALRDGDEHERGDEEAIAHEAERRDSESPRRDREEHRDALSPHTLRPSRRERGDERADAGSGEEKPEALRPDSEDPVGIEREERPRRAEEGREEVQQHGPEENAIGSEVRETFDQGTTDRQMDADLAWRRDEQRDR